MLKPIIGITTYYVSSRELGPNFVRGAAGQDFLMSTMDYSRSIEEAGGIPVTIPVINNLDYIKDLAQKLDGFLFTGGSDISPLIYGQSFKRGMGLVVPERDEFELSLLKYVLELDKSVFGICRGFQLLNVYFGGTLHQDAWNNGFQDIEHKANMIPKTYPVHYVSFKKDSLIDHAFNKERLMVNSFHHQIIDKLAPSLEKTAWADDGVIEGIQHKDFPFVLGVQWHPEMMVESNKEQLTLFKIFIDSIKNNNT